MIFSATSASLITLSLNDLQTLSSADDIVAMISGSNAWFARNGRIGTNDLMADRAEARAGRDGNVPSFLGTTDQRRSRSGRLAIFTAMRRASSVAIRLEAVRWPGSSLAS
jgi:hypothetical protein